MISVARMLVGWSDGTRALKTCRKFFVIVHKSPFFYILKFGHLEFETFFYTLYSKHSSERNQCHM